MKNKQTPNSYSGIKVADNISLTLPKRKFIPEFIPLIFIALCGCIGIIYSFITMFQIQFSHKSLNFFILFFFALFSITFILPKKFMFSLIPIFLIYELFLYRKWDSFSKGFMLVYNQVYKVIWPGSRDYFKIKISLFDVESATATFIGFSVFILIALICYVTIVKPNFFLGFLFTFPLIEIGLYYGKSPALFPIFMIVIYWTALMSIHQSGYSKNLGRSKTGFIRTGNSFISKPIIKFRTAGQAGIIMMMMSALIIVATFIFLNISGYSRSMNINNVRQNLKTAVSEFTFDDISGSLDRISSSFGIINLKSYDHKLGNKSSVSYKGSTDLTITADDSARPLDNIYLKGYVASVYDGKGWDALDKNSYNQNSDLFELFKMSNVLYPQNMLYNNYGLYRSFLSSSMDSEFTMTIEAKFQNTKYNYTPYNSVPQKNVTYINDTLIELDNKSKYSFNVSIYQDFNHVFGEDISYFADSEYSDFVYENYLNVPDNKYTQELYNTFIDENVNQRDVASQLKRIKNILSENAEYTLEPGRTPTGTDFVNYFLLENHKGYCVHFATAGVILARMSGIPARYAEGYVVLTDDFSAENLMDDGYKIEIKDNRAHAWAEIYVDGIGWIPYEFTPASANPFDPEQPTQNENKTTKSASTNVTKSGNGTKNNKNTNPNNSTTAIIKTTVNSASVNKTLNGVKKADSSKISIETKLTLSAVIIIVFVIAIILIVHFYVTKKRRKSFNTDSPSKNALNAYNYILKLLEFCDIKNDNMQYLEFAKYAEENTKNIFKADDFTKITKIALAAKLSNQEISQEQANTVVNLALRTAVIIFKYKNIFNRIYMTFIKNLY